MQELAPRRIRMVDPWKNKGKKLRKGILWCITGDLDWYAEEFGFPYAGANKLCPYCDADQQKHGSPMPFTDFRAGAKRRGSVLNVKELQKKYQHPLFAAPSVSIVSVKLDILHTLDLGVAAYLHGSLLYSIMEELPASNSHPPAQICIGMLGFIATM